MQKAYGVWSVIVNVFVRIDLNSADSMFSYVFIYFCVLKIMKMRKHFIAILVFTLSIFASGYTQDKDEKLKPDAIWAVYPSYSFQWPGGDMADRFGANSTIGPGGFYKTSSNWVFNVDINFLFGNKIKEDSLIQNLINTDGFVIGDQGLYSEVSFFERGFYTQGRVGKLIPLSEENLNSGILLLAGAGYMQHKINIEVTNETASPLKGEYKKGYDRFTNGFSTSQFIGYMHLGNSRLANFFGGVEIVEAWTKNRRSMNFDTMSRDDKDRFDFLVGIKVGWVIPFSKREPEEFYYY